MTNFGKELIQSAKEALAMTEIAALDRLIESVEAGTLTGGMTDPIRALHIGTITIQGTDADIKRMLREFWGVIALTNANQTDTGHIGDHAKEGMK